MSKTGCDVVASGAELSSSMSCNVTLVFVQEVADEKSCVMSKAVQWLTSRGKQSAKRESGTSSLSFVAREVVVFSDDAVFIHYICREKDLLLTVTYCSRMCCISGNDDDLVSE